MQGDAVTIAAVGMGTLRDAQKLMEDLRTEARCHGECFTTRGHISGYQREVRLCSSRFLGPVLTSCPLKVHDGTSPMEWGHPPFVRRVPRVPPESPHAGDRMDR